jgi:hypothetical protein
MKTNKKLFMPLNLQFFAEDGGDDNSGDHTETEFNIDELNEEQLAAIKEKFGFKDDKDVDSIIKTKKSRWQKELEEQKNEAARLAKLSEKERQQAIFDKEREDFEKEKEQFRKEQLFVEKGKQLAKQGMPADFASRINGETAEEILEDVKAIREEWDKAVETKVNERLASKNKTKIGTSTGQMTKAEIMAIKDTSERQRMIAANRELF